MRNVKHDARSYFEALQNTICSGLEAADGKERFREETWSHAEHGGGKTRILQNGAVIEKGGVNFSAVTTKLSVLLAARMNIQPQTLFAAGISLVIHPFSPMIPAIHMNLRYLEPEQGEPWFGGGIDLTPSYLFEEDAVYFHNTLKAVCDKHHAEYYPKFKKWCDEYFFIKHRSETRGIGGIFFDYQRENPDRFFSFVKSMGDCFLDAYVPIVEKRKKEVWAEKEKSWQLIRRGRYAEFNLIYDRGTLFGLETQGRTESILMSLPPEVRWAYNHSPEAGSREDQLLNILQHPKNWV